MVPGCDAIAIEAGYIRAVGRTEELAKLPANARRLDAFGCTVTPGLTDAHLHLVDWARALDDLDLSGARTRAAALELVARRVAETESEPDSPLVGRGWDANDWTEPPERGALDSVSGSRVVLLHSKDFHNLWVNSAALRAAGIDRATPDPLGGRIARDAAGEPTGVLGEHAVRLCAGLFDRATVASEAQRVRAAVRRLHALGVTAVHDFEGPDAFRVLRDLTRHSGGRVRVLMHLAHAGLDHAIALGLESGVGDDWFRIGAVKLFADGTLGSRTAALLAPYDRSAERGSELIPPGELAALVRRAMSSGLSVAIHAIGDRACRSALDAFQAAGPLRDRVALPPRVEHVQLLDPSDAPRFAALGVAASMQPVHCTSDRDLAERWWGSRRAHAYPWRTLREAGALLAFGSDAPVEPPSVAAGLHAAVTRERPGDSTPFVPDQAIGLDAALSAYTESAARLAGSWPRLGTLRPGATADLVVWNEDLHGLPPARVCDAVPRATVIDGELVYEREGRSAGPAVATAAGKGVR